VHAVVKVFPTFVGDTVNRDEVLIELDDRTYKLNLLRAEVALKGIESRLNLAQYQMDQATALFEQKAITDELLQQRSAEVDTLKAERNAKRVEVAMAKRDLDKCTIRAPFKATLLERIAQTGELASPGTPLVRIIDAARIEVSARIQPQDISSLKDTKTFEFITQDETYDVSLRKITPAFDPVQRNQEARFNFKRKRALPGATGTLRWKQSKAHIPANLLIKRDKTLGVFIIVSGKAKFMELPNAREGRPALTNLPDYTTLIIDGRFGVQDGTALRLDK